MDHNSDICTILLQLVIELGSTIIYTYCMYNYVLQLVASTIKVLVLLCMYACKITVDEDASSSIVILHVHIQSKTST